MKHSVLNSSLGDLTLPLVGVGTHSVGNILVLPPKDSVIGGWAPDGRPSWASGDTRAYGSRLIVGHVTLASANHALPLFDNWPLARVCGRDGLGSLRVERYFG